MPVISVEAAPTRPRPISTDGFTNSGLSDFLLSSEPHTIAYTDDAKVADVHSRAMMQ